MAVEEGDRIIYARDVDMRIEQLESDDDLLEDEQDELEALAKFRADAKDAIYVWEESTSFIAEHEFPDYITGEAEEYFSKEAVDSGYFKLTEYIDDRRAEFQKITFGSTTYFADGR